MRVLTFGQRSEGIGFQKNRIGYPAKAPVASALSAQALDVPADEFSRADEFSKGESICPVTPTSRNTAFQQVIQSVMARLTEGIHAPPQEVVLKNRPRKVAVARQLTDWMTQTLAANDIPLAVVTRQGGLQHKRYDPTGMFHSGLALFHPRERRWKIYNLIDEKIGGQWHCDIQWTAPEDFFYQQGGYQARSLILVPDRETRNRIRQALLNGDYKKLLFTNEYHLVSDPASGQSLNCNKWVLLNVLAAQKQDYNPARLLKEIGENYQPDPIDIHPLIRPFAWLQPHVRSAEVPWLAPIQTVTVNSLLASGLFENTFSCEAATQRESPDKAG